MDDLLFITDGSLRKTIEDSIDYTYFLFEESKKRSDKKLYQEEACRVIILYTVSIIEAILLYFYKKGGYQASYTEYKYIASLPEGYGHKEASGGHVVIAVQRQVNVEEYKITLKVLVDYFKDQKLVSKQITKEILAINDLRNTFHLSKSREKISCNVTQVERAFKLLVYAIQKAPKDLIGTVK